MEREWGTSCESAGGLGAFSDEAIAVVVSNSVLLVHWKALLIVRERMR